MIHLPQINKKYWLLMILATTIGEITGNLISRNLGLGYIWGSLLLISVFLIALIAVVIAGTQSHICYWSLILLGNIAGTNCADFITIEPLQLGTIYGSIFVMGMLAILFFLWKKLAPASSIEKGLSVTTEYLYWLCILFSSTFGTTFGDYLSNDTNLGAAGGTMLLILLFGIVGFLSIYKKITTEVSYWLALIIIHPIGATFGNYISKPEGLNFGNIWTSLILISAFILLFMSQYMNRHPQPS